MKTADFDLNRENISLRVCSYNIHKGFSANNGHFLLKEIRHAIRLVNADMLFLQEVVGENTRKAFSVPNWIPETQFEFLADSVWPHHAYGKNAVYDHGHHGNAILSRYPLSDWNNVDLSMIPFSNRGLLHAKILGHLHLFCVHFGLMTFEQKAQLKRVVEIVNQNTDITDPVIIAGDFNDWRNKAASILQKQLNLQEVTSSICSKPCATFPAFFPILPMDRIYFRGLDLVDGDVLTGSPWHALSDHCAVYAEFKFANTQH